MRCRVISARGFGSAKIRPIPVLDASRTSSSAKAEALTSRASAICFALDRGSVLCPSCGPTRQVQGSLHPPRAELTAAIHRLDLPFQTDFVRTPLSPWKETGTTTR